MFPGSTEPELEVGILRSGRKFMQRKRRKAIGGRKTPSLIEESEYKVESRLDERYCNEEEDYSLIFEGLEESEDSVETPISECNYHARSITRGEV